MNVTQDKPSFPLSLMCWNCRGIMTGILYLNQCLMNEHVDICAIADHQLREYNSSFLDSVLTNHTFIARPAPDCKDSSN